MNQAQTILAEDRARFKAQTQRILDRLKEGPVLNTELARVALKYTSRISDLREAGHDIRCDRVGGGQTMYYLLDRDATPRGQQVSA